MGRGEIPSRFLFFPEFDRCIYVRAGGWVIRRAVNVTGRFYPGWSSMKTRFLFCLSLLLLSAFSASGQHVVNVPNGRPVLVDGKCEAEEWNDAAELSTSKDYKLLFKKTTDYVFICVAPVKEGNFIVDLYLSAAGGKLHTLHVSAKLGERVLEGAQWKEWTVDWNWWEVRDWWANTLRLVSFENRSILPSKAIEFQIGRKRFGGKHWRVMFDFISGGSIIFPTDASNLKSQTWLDLDLSR